MKEEEDNNVLFGDEDDLFGTVVGSRQLQQFGMLQFVHDGHLLVDFLAVGRLNAPHVFGCPESAAGPIDQSVNDAKTAFAQLFVNRVLFLIETIQN